MQALDHVLPVGDTLSRISEDGHHRQQGHAEHGAGMVPEPPLRLAPPITAAAMTLSSMPTPKVGVAAPKRAM